MACTGSYTWSTGAATNTITASPATTTTYMVTGNTLGCIGTATGTITVGASDVSATSVTICAGQSATLTASGASTYVWSTGDATSTITSSPVVTTTYTVTGTANGCTKTTTGTITVNPVPIITSNSATVCIGTPATLTASGATSYSWSNGGSAADMTASPTVTTTYTVTGNTLGCENTSTSTVTVNPLPIVTVNSPNICPGLMASLVANGATNYAWSAGPTPTGTGTATVSPASTTSYTVTGSTLGCLNTAVATVTLGGTLTPIMNAPTICNGQTATVIAGGATTYIWSTGATTSSITVSPTVTTSYTVIGTTGGCEGPNITTVTVNPIPVIIVNSATVCPGLPATITASGADSYSWSNGSAAADMTASPIVTSTYTVTGSTLGCLNTATGIITVSPIPVVSVSSATVCIGVSATLTAYG